jgi:hypothetical protein
MGKCQAIIKQARRSEQACPPNNRDGSRSIQFEVNGEFTGGMLDRQGFAVSWADLRNALGDRTWDHTGGGHRDGREDADGGVAGVWDQRRP